MRGLARIFILGPIVSLTAAAGLATLILATLTSILSIAATAVDDELS